MGAKRTANTELPKGMRARVRKGTWRNDFKDRTYYTYDIGQRPRVEIMLAIDDFGKAISEFEKKVRPLTLLEQKTMFEHDKFSIPPDDYKRLFTTMRKGATTRNLEVSITEQDVRLMLESSGDRCAVTGIRFNTFKPADTRMRPWIPSIDRIDRTRGYHNDNVRVVCACVNLALNQFGDNTLLLIADCVIDRSSKNRKALI